MLFIPSDMEAAMNDDSYDEVITDEVDTDGIDDSQMSPLDTDAFSPRAFPFVVEVEIASIICNVIDGMDSIISAG
jgi:hypothetical protein